MPSTIWLLIILAITPDGIVGSKSYAVPDSSRAECTAAGIRLQEEYSKKNYKAINFMCMEAHLGTPEEANKIPNSQST